MSAQGTQNLLCKPDHLKYVSANPTANTCLRRSGLQKKNKAYPVQTWSDTPRPLHNLKNISERSIECILVPTTKWLTDWLTHKLQTLQSLLDGFKEEKDFRYVFQSYREVLVCQTMSAQGTQNFVCKPQHLKYVFAVGVADPTNQLRDWSIFLTGSIKI